MISDIVSDRRVSPEVANDPILVAECLGMAPYIHDAHDTMFDAGFPDVRVCHRRELAPNPRVLAHGDATRFYSVIWRGYKLENMDRRCEDFGQMAVYNGGLNPAKLDPNDLGAEQFRPTEATIAAANQVARFQLDEGHIFEAHRPTHVCRNTARMLTETRLGKYFSVTEPVRHFGLLDECTTPAAQANGEGFAGSCC